MCKINRTIHLTDPKLVHWLASPFSSCSVHVIPHSAYLGICPIWESEKNKLVFDSKIIIIKKKTWLKKRLNLIWPSYSHFCLLSHCEISLKINWRPKLWNVSQGPDQEMELPQLSLINWSNKQPDLNDFLKYSSQRTAGCVAILDLRMLLFPCQGDLMLFSLKQMTKKTEKTSSWRLLVQSWCWRPRATEWDPAKQPHRVRDPGSLCLTPANLSGRLELPVRVGTFSRDWVTYSWLYHWLGSTTGWLIFPRPTVIWLNHSES